MFFFLVLKKKIRATVGTLKRVRLCVCLRVRSLHRSPCRPDVRAPVGGSLPCSFVS